MAQTFIPALELLQKSVELTDLQQSSQSALLQIFFEELTTLGVDSTMMELLELTTKLILACDGWQRQLKILRAFRIKFSCLTHIRVIFMSLVIITRFDVTQQSINVLECIGSTVVLRTFMMASKVRKVVKLLMFWFAIRKLLQKYFLSKKFCNQL